MRKLNGYGPSLIVLATALLVLFVGPSAVQQLTYQQTQTRMIQASRRLDRNNILEQINQAYVDIASFVEPSVVHISAEQAVQSPRGYAPLSTGSGWVYDADGHVVTNFHVVQDAERIQIQLSSGELREAEILGFDRSTDIAVLKIPTGRLHPAVRAAVREQPVKQGDLIFAFGSPFDFRFSMSSGVVSGKGRSVDVLGQSGYENFIQVDAAINPGNSGGPLTDYHGQVIGMNTAIATGRRTSLEEGQFAGIGLAIPLEMIEPVVSQIIEKGVVDKGLLGVVPAELNVREAQRLGFIGSGVLIIEVAPGFPAALAGVEANDIVTAVNGQAVANPSQLRSIVSSMLPGATAQLSIWRPDSENGTGDALQIAVRLDRLDPLRDTGRLPEDQSAEQILQLGIAKMSDSTTALATRFGVEFHRGVFVERVVPGSAIAAVVDPGSTIVSVMEYPVADVEEFLEALRRYNLRRGVHVGVIQADGRPARALLKVQP